MPKKSLTVAIPMAGLGTRMRPLTWSKPKPLISLAGRTVLDFVLDQFETVPADFDITYVCIIGPWQGDQVREHMETYHPEKRVKYVVQAEMRGQSDALYLARQFLDGPVIMAFSDTLIETNFACLGSNPPDACAWIKAVPDPRRFGVTELGPDGLVRRLIEKPTDMNNNLVVVGCYYFNDGCALIDAIEE
ncbi:MAG: nucleotidyltransferase family protein [Anaerolineae bacterium]|nr:nucleotidyltransferase family protein [Anaerolineae bacterium]